MRARRFIPLLPVAATTAALLLAPASARAQASDGWETLRSLVGEWEGSNDAGAPIRVSYRLVSGGTALLETLRSPDEPEMVTVYHPDDSGLALTHYCSAGNQPFMRLTSGGPTGLTFDVVRVSGPVEPASGHMAGLTLSLDDEGRLRQRWRYRQGDGTEVTTFELRRTSR